MIGSSMLIVTAYTPDYVDHFQRLRWTAAAQDEDLHVVRLPEYPAAQRWHMATAQKPLVLLDALHRFKRPVMWIDSDAAIWGRVSPFFDTLAEQGVDMACHWFNQDAVDSRPRHPHGRMLTGTLWLNNTPRARDLLGAWIARNWSKQQAGDWTGGGQRNLWELIRDNAIPDLRMERVGGRYCYIDLPSKRKAYPADEPKIIEHFIASRENREPSKPRNERKLVEYRQAVADAKAKIENATHTNLED